MEASEIEGEPVLEKKTKHLPLLNVGQLNKAAGSRFTSWTDSKTVRSVVWFGLVCLHQRQRDLSYLGLVTSQY